MEINKDKETSGNNLTWNDFPKRQVSKFPIAVRKSTKNSDPKYPPKSVCNCDELNQGLNICIPENISTELIEDNINEVPVATAILIDTLWD